MPKGVLGRIVALVDVHQCCLVAYFTATVTTSLLTQQQLQEISLAQMTYQVSEWLLLLAVRLQRICVNNIFRF